MPVTSEAYVTPALVRWALARAGTTAESVARKVGAKPDSIASWESGESHPTLRQAEKLANVLLVPFGYLFLPEPPKESVPLPDFRTVKNEVVATPSANFMALLYDVLRKHWWYEQTAIDQGNPELPFVGKYSLDSSTDLIAKDISHTIGITEQVRKESTSWEAFLTLLIRRAEALKILVMRGSYVPGTRRNVSHEEFRGFAIGTSRRAPLIFINSSDFKAAQIFTFAHELTHVWLGQAGISNESLKEPQDNIVEQKCNAVAAEILTPQQSFLDRWNSTASVEHNLSSLTHYFRVSSLVVLWRARNLHRISRDVFNTSYKKEEERFRQQQKKQKSKKNSGPSFYETLLSQTGELFAATVLDAISEERASFAEGARLLNLRVPLLANLAKQIEKRHTPST